MTGTHQAEDPGSALAAEDAATVRAAVERVIPSDDGPGAREAGTAAYVLARATASPEARDAYHTLAGRLAAIAAEATPGASFASLAADDQDRVLGVLDAAGDPTFRRLVIDAMEGFYGDPRHGGNAGGVSWQLIGFPGPTGGAGYEPPLGWWDAHVEPRA